LGLAGDPGDVTIEESGEGKKKRTRQYGLSHAEFLNYSDKMLRAKETADKAIEKLGLGGQAARNVWDSALRLPSTRTAASIEGEGSQSHVEGHQDAADEALDVAKGTSASVQVEGPKPAEPAE
jgi:hypothetical protein